MVGEATVPILEIITGPHTQHQFSVEKVGIWIGSDERCDINLKEPGISKFHAQIILDPTGVYWVEDAGSSFGTLLNGEELERQVLSHGDILTLGRTKLRFVNEAESRESSTSTAPVFDGAREHEMPTQFNPEQASASVDLLYDSPSPQQPSPYAPTPAAGLHVPPLQSSSLPLVQLESEGCEILENDDDDGEILDGDALELIEESEFDLDGVDEEKMSHPMKEKEPHPAVPTYDEMTIAGSSQREEKPSPRQVEEPAQEGTALAPIPLSPDAFLTQNPATSEAESEAEGTDDEPVSETEGTLRTQLPEAPVPPPAEWRQPPQVTKRADIPDSEKKHSEETVLKKVPQRPLEPENTYTVNHDEEEDLHGSPPAPRSRTVLFNLELERLKFQLQEREKQLDQLQTEANSRASQEEQHEWLQRTLEMVREDNQRLQYQITAYEDAAEENEELIQKVIALEKANMALHKENYALREQLDRYENYYYQQAGSYNGTTS